MLEEKKVVREKNRNEDFWTGSWFHKYEEVIKILERIFAILQPEPLFKLDSKFLIEI